MWGTHFPTALEGISQVLQARLGAAIADRGLDVFSRVRAGFIALLTPDSWLPTQAQEQREHPSD
ncbi:MAG: hypothetical protein AAGH78_07520 [Cyanobacteria bacterium P01_H01_bin.58]